MEENSKSAARIPTATYRLQFNTGFTFDRAREIVPYLYELGISDVYASSYFAAKAGSVHGYDVVNHTLLNPEIGDEGSHRALVEELARHGMGHIIDFVPNHMCIESAENLWWMDVLENGMSSPFANFFDIDWAPVKKELTGKVLLPFLGDQYGRVLENGDLTLAFRDGAFLVDYFGLKIPVEPKSYLKILSHRPERLQEAFPPEAPPLMEMLSIETALQHLPSANEQDPQLKEERHREKEIVKKRLAQLCEASPQVQAYIDENVALFNGKKGEPESFDLLDALLREQPYRLSFWRVATEEINYRRFFDINALAAIRMEDPAVYDRTHALLLRLIGEGMVTGVRIDHVDGLYDPLGYLKKLQQSAWVELRLRELGKGGEGEEPGEEELQALQEEYRLTLERDPAYKPFYAVVEKILTKGETLPEQWPVFGTTGYDFMNSVNGVFVDTEKGKLADRVYHRFVLAVLDYAEIVYRKKQLVMSVSLSGEANMLAHQLNNISEQDRLTRDFTLNSLARAIHEVIACFPVYRTYAASNSVRDKDVQYIELAVAKAKRKNPAINASIFDFLRDVLLLRFPDRAGETDRASWLSFDMRFQQITGPVMAKGLEDTAFYVYNRLISLNEVGGSPGRFGTSREAFHGQNLERVKNFPHAMLATATHDSKRGEDVRTRIDALSEVPESWQKALALWRRLNKGKAVLLENQPVPDRNEEYLLYQTLLGTWPFCEPDDGAFETYRARIGEYMIKAVREAKVNTSWVSPNAAYEEAVLSFVGRVLEGGPGNGFLKEFRSVKQRVAHWGAFSSLSQVVLKMTAPGVPDFYQGTELWDLTLVDPDNRRPVDYRQRRELLAGLKERESAIGAAALTCELQGDLADGRIKLYLVYRVLNYRRQNRELFDAGDYLPIEPSGERARHVCAFLRRCGGKTLLVAVPRLLATLLPAADRPPLGEGVWLDTGLPLPEDAPGRYRNVLTGREVEAVEQGGVRMLEVATVFGEAPVALLEST